MPAASSDNRLLVLPLARELFHDVARDLPVIDFHCHLSAQDLAEDRRFASITELWIASDPYKHRAMRIAGVPEREITGMASDHVKFQRWAETVPATVANPLYEWTALELARTFDVMEPLNPGSADRIWEHCKDRLASTKGSARSLLEQANVERVFTSDRLGDDLSHHARLQASGFSVAVHPSLRADEVMAVDEESYPAWAASLGAESWTAFTSAVKRRLDEFDVLGCRLADHGMDTFLFVHTTEEQTAILWEKRLRGGPLDRAESERLRSGLLLWLCRQYAAREWVLQLHLGALRETSSRLRREAGPAGGFAGIGTEVNVSALVRFLDALESTGDLPRTILYPLDPTLNIPLAVLSGSFVAEGIAGKVQLGPAWWYHDHRSGIRAVLEAVANYGLLSAFIGMTTDSRSLLSMARHEYFRRVLCSWISEKVQCGEIPTDPARLQSLITALCHGNAARWFSPQSTSSKTHS